MKNCATCGTPHDRYRDAKHTKAASTYRPRYRELTREQKRRSATRAYANVYQRRGKLSALPCECGCAARVQKHHDDYARPLDVRWLCVASHNALHRARMFPVKHPNKGSRNQTVAAR